ncbi:MAG: futalosine hydrolase [Planctomycetota bacterium]
MPADLLVCVATPQEGAELAHMIGAGGTVAGRSVALVKTGIGCVNAAHAVSLHLARETPGAVIVCGVGGAYPGSGLEVGDVACAESEFYADLGAESPGAFLDMETLGYPVIEGDPCLFNRLPLHRFPTKRRLPFVTRSTCTGTDATALEIATRTGGAVESMEGAAVVHVALHHGVPVGEVRGISNTVGNRNRGSWRVKAAARAAQSALVRWIEEGGC